MPPQHPPVVLLTGFEPFGGESRNPSWDAAALLDGRTVCGHQIVSVRLPVEFSASARVLEDAIREMAPALVLCVGQAGGRAKLSIERVAININDARIADNAGAAPVDEPVVEGGPAAYFSNLPIKAMLAELDAAGIPAEISQTAGTYVCNHVFYALMHALQARAGVRGGFVHIPYSPEQAAMHQDAPGLALDTVVAALEIALGAALATTADRRYAAGAEH